MDIRRVAVVRVLDASWKFFRQCGLQLPVAVLLFGESVSLRVARPVRGSVSLRVCCCTGCREEVG